MARGKTLLATIIITLLAAILLAITNPARESHIEAINHRLATRDVLTNVINRGLFAVKPPAYHSLVLFSYTKWDNAVTSIGALGYVWVDVKTFK